MYNNVPASTNASYVLSSMTRICGSNLSANLGCTLKNVESNFVKPLRTPILETAPPTSIKTFVYLFQFQEL